MDSYISNFRATFPFAEDFLRKTPMMCINFRKCSAIAKCLKKYLVEDVVKIILEFLQSRVFSGILDSEENPRTMVGISNEEFFYKEGGVIKSTDLDDFIFILRKDKTGVYHDSHLFLGVFSDKTPRLVVNDVYSKLFKTEIIKDGKTFFVPPCPFEIAGVHSSSIHTDIPCTQVYVYSPLVREYISKLSKEKKYVIYKNSQGKIFGTTANGLLWIKP